MYPGLDESEHNKVNITSFFLRNSTLRPVSPPWIGQRWWSILNLITFCCFWKANKEKNPPRGKLPHECAPQKRPFKLSANLTYFYCNFSRRQGQPGPPRLSHTVQQIEAGYTSSYNHQPLKTREYISLSTGKQNSKVLNLTSRAQKKPEGCSQSKPRHALKSTLPSYKLISEQGRGKAREELKSPAFTLCGDPQETPLSDAPAKIPALGRQAPPSLATGGAPPLPPLPIGRRGYI